MSFLRRMYTGDRPVPAPPPPPPGPRPLTVEDIDAWKDAAAHRIGMATYSEMLFVLNRLRGSDPVRVWSIKKDLKWLARKAHRMGIDWNDPDLRVS